MNDLWDLGLEPLPEQWLTGGAGELSGAADIGVDGNQVRVLVSFVRGA